MTLKNDNISIQAEGAWRYQEACAVISELRTIGIDSGVTVGGIWISFDLENHGLAVIQIVKKHKGRFCQQTFMQAITTESADKIIKQRIVDRLEELWIL